jgi:Ca2+-binding RTX toxin-like protein
LAESCVYDPVAKSVTASITPGGQATLVVSGAAPAAELRFGQIPTACGGATTTNTDTINISGAPGNVETLVLDERGGIFAPGATSEFSISEIEFNVDMGDTIDTIIVHGTEGDDELAAGQNGLALNGDGDQDVVVTPGAFNLEVYLLGGNDFFNGRGTFGAGLHFLGPITVGAGVGNDFVRGSTFADNISGGDGNDVLEGNDGPDAIDSGTGDDTINAGAGNDVLTGGSGFDTNFIAGAGDDVVYVNDGQADGSMTGGAGADTLYYDGGLDTTFTGFETLFAGGGPPPPPPPPPPPTERRGG